MHQGRALAGATSLAAALHTRRAKRMFVLSPRRGLRQSKSCVLCAAVRFPKRSLLMLVLANIAMLGPSRAALVSSQLIRQAWLPSVLPEQDM